MKYGNKVKIGKVLFKIFFEVVKYFYDSMAISYSIGKLVYVTKIITYFWKYFNKSSCYITSIHVCMYVYMHACMQFL